MELLYLSAFVVGLTQVFKIAFNISKRYIPLVAVVTALVIAVVFTQFSNTALTWTAIQNALIAGLSSVGLWEVGSKTVAGK